MTRTQRAAYEKRHQDSALSETRAEVSWRFLLGRPEPEAVRLNENHTIRKGVIPMKSSRQSSRPR